MIRMVSIAFRVILLLNTAGCDQGSVEMKVDSVRQVQVNEERVHIFEQNEDDPPCGQLELTGSPILPEEVEGAPGSATGGAIEDGTYRVVAQRVYGLLPEQGRVPFHQTAQFFDGGNSLLLVNEAGGTERVSKYEARVAGETIELTAACPKSIAGTKSKVAYSSGGGQLTFQIDRTDGLRMEIVYERVAENSRNGEQ